MQQRTLVALKTITPLVLLSFSLAARAQTVIPTATVNWTTTHQAIDGFGMSCFFVSTCDPMTPAVTTLAFDKNNGIGLSLFRYYYEPALNGCQPTCTFTMTQPVQAAIAAGAKVFMTPMSPPGSMKLPSGSTNICNSASGNTTLNPSSYAAYATLLKGFATQFQSTFGAPLYAISVQNEPNYCPTTYSGAIYTGTNIHDFIKNNLGPTMAGSGVQIMMPEDTWWNDMNNGSASIFDTTMTDPTAAAFVGIVASHDYTQQNAVFSAPNIAPYSHLGNARLWQTETSINTPFDTSIQQGLTWAQNIHNYMSAANANAWFYFLIMTGPGENDMLGLIDSSGNVSKTFYVVGNWSKFVRPGWVRIDATTNPVNGVYVTAFKDPSAGGFAIVAVNQNSSSADLAVSLAGFPSVTTVTPTLTSASANLVDQSNVDASTGGTDSPLRAAKPAFLIWIAFAHVKGQRRIRA